jgi:predicted nucleic acid-binding protein
MKLWRSSTCFSIRVIFCAPAPLSGISPDPKDDKFLACALAARADFVVTGNKKDFPNDELGATQVVSTGELLNLITLEL